MGPYARPVKGLWEHWSGTIAVVIVAVALGILAIWFHPFDNSWVVLVWGLAGAVALVTASGYRTRRDPALLLIAAGAAALALWYLVYTVTAEVRAARATDLPVDNWLRALGSYGPFFGLATFIACLAMTVPWRDRRGRPPLRVLTVCLSVAIPSLVAAILVVVAHTLPTNLQFRVQASALAVVALVSGARAITRGGWHRWVGGASFAIMLAAAALWVLAREGAAQRTVETALLWFLFMPSVAVVAVLLGVLQSQRTEAVRLRRASDRATQVMEGRAEIASIVAHDVRGPAGTIRSVAGSLRTSYARLRDDERLEFVGMIEQESLRLLRVAEQMSLGLKTDAGTLPFSLVDRDIEGPVLQGVHDAEAGSREIRLDVDPSVHAKVDERWLAEAVRQGLENAMKFSPPDTPIDVRGRAEGKIVLVEVEDQGPGIPEDMREAVFQKFCRWRPNGYEDRPGSGLGLFVVRSIAREHDGDALVTEGAHGGTILQIRLPLEGDL
jgi:signal transduction histidine kinase